MVTMMMVMVSGGKGMRVFGYTIKPNGCMNKAFGDPAPVRTSLRVALCACSVHVSCRLTW
jgi:hypothetical protein